MQSHLTSDKVTLKYIDTGAAGGEDALKPCIILVSTLISELPFYHSLFFFLIYYVNIFPSSGLINEDSIWYISQRGAIPEPEGWRS